jgi:hypothetical protein
MIERICKSCKKVFGQSLDDGASGDDTANRFCEVCRNVSADIVEETEADAEPGTAAITEDKI